VAVDKIESTQTKKIKHTRHRRCDKESKKVVKGCLRIAALIRLKWKPCSLLIASFILPTFFVHPSRFLPLSVPECSSIRPRGREGPFVYPSQTLRLSVPRHEMRMKAVRSPQVAFLEGWP